MKQPKGMNRKLILGMYCDIRTLCKYLQRARVGFMPADEQLAFIALELSTTNAEAGVCYGAK